MKNEVLNRFDMPHLPIIALIIFLVVFIGYSWWTLRPVNKKYYDDAAQLPFADENGVKHE